MPFCIFYVIWISIRKTRLPFTPLVLIGHVIPRYGSVISPPAFLALTAISHSIGIKTKFLITKRRKILKFYMPELCWNWRKYQGINLAWVICRRNINYEETKRKCLYHWYFFSSNMCYKLTLSAFCNIYCKIPDLYLLWMSQQWK